MDAWLADTRQPCADISSHACIASFAERFAKPETDDESSFPARRTVLGAIASLSGCYYDPGYSYVRATSYSGDVYYGQAAPVYQGGYGYAPFGYGYDGGSYYGCCGVGIIGGWYGGPRYYGGRGYYPGRYCYGGRWDGRWQGHPPYRGGRPGYGGHVDRGGGHGYERGFHGGTGYRGSH